jgi:hypothetical protein
VNRKPPSITGVKAQPPATLELTFGTGETLRADVSALLRRFKLYAPLKQARTFAKARPDAWGHAVRWPGGIDIDAGRLYEIARTQAGEWGPERFDRWMADNDLSLTTAAEALGMTRRMVAHYRTGSRPIPRVVALACEGWEVRKAA